MKKITLISACALAVLTVASCGNNKSKKAEAPSCPEYTVVENEEVDLATLPQDEDGYYILFDGQTLNGFRGYGKAGVPARWVVDDGAIHFVGSGAGEAQAQDGGDIIFAHQFKNFTLEFDWKVAKGANSGVFYLSREVTTVNDKGETIYEPIYISAPEYQILDNENHPDAQLGVDGNRKSASLYDMIPAKPQNAKPYGEWNTGKIIVYKGTIVHGQNGENVLEYHMWTPKWDEMLQNSKFSEEAWPLAYELLSNCGGEEHQGYIGFQDHGDDVWFRNIRVKVMD